MDTRTSTEPPRILRLAIVAAGLAFAWILLSFALGLSSSEARADDGDDGMSLGGLVGSVVDDAVGGVTDAATQTVGTLNSVVTTAVTSAPLPAPVTEVVSPVAGAASSAVAGAAGAAESAASSGLAAPVVDAVTAVVARTPVVGDVTARLGLDDALSAVGASVDGAVEQVAGSIGGTAAAIQLPALPTAPPALGCSPGGASDTAVQPADAAGDHVRTPGDLTAHTWEARLSAATLPAPTTTPASPVGPSAVAATYFPLGMSLPADASSAGPGGSGPGAWGLLAFGPLVAYRAWVRRRGPDDERVPAAPFLATDVSPD